MLLLGYKGNHKVCKNKVSKKIRKIFKFYEIPDLSFEVLILNSFSTSRYVYPIRVSKLGERLNRFDCKASLK